MGESETQRKARETLAGADWEQIMTDSQTEAEKRFAPIYEKIGALSDEAANIPSFTEWQTQGANRGLQGYDDQLSGIQDIIDKWGTGPSAEDYDSAFGHAARTVGLDANQFNAILGDLSQQMAGGPSAQEGLTPEEEQAMRAANQAMMREMEARNIRLVQDSMADTGSTARMLQTASEASAQMNSVQLQQEYAVLQADAERQVMQFESKKQTWMAMVEANQIGVDQYISNLEEGASLAMQGYATQVQTVMARNADVFKQYESDLNAMIAGINATYQAITAEIGVTAAEIDAANSIYAQTVQPMLDQLQAAITEEELGKDPFMVVGGFLGIAAGVALLFIPGFQPAGIALIGSGGGLVAGA
ncbi:MAG TPA: hypothetical protein VMX15_06470 [Candidatus Heimdallarchaeota archaeon]|nr:hypothetical protein [Candidatus Heimdallarchaeota archaeon]